MKKINLTVSTMQGCGGIESTGFNSFTLGGCGGLDRTDFNSFHFARVWQS